MAYTYFETALNDWLSCGENTQTTLAIGSGYKKSYISQLLSEKRTTPIGFEPQTRIAAACGYSYLAFLQHGKNLLEGKPTTPEAPGPIIITATSDRDKHHLTENVANYRSVPLYTSGRLAAWSNGSAFDRYEAPTSDVLVYTPELGHRAKHHLVAARVGGDSMEPLVPMNSIIIVDMDDKEFVDNKVFAVAIDEGGVKTLAVKRVRKFEKAKGFVLWSENQEYQPVLVVESDWLRLCVGRVVWMWRSFEG